MSKLSKSKNRKGFTLIEAMVSVLILGIALVVLLGSFIMGRMNAAAAKHHIEAMNHAQAAMEQCLNSGATTYTLPDGDIKILSGTCTVSSASYTTGINRIVATVSWNERSIGGSRQVSEQLVTLVRQ